MQAPSGVLEHRFDLRTGHPGKPFHELVDRRPALEVLEQRMDRHARASEYPGAADDVRISLDGFAGAPIQHEGALYREDVRPAIAGFPPGGTTTPDFADSWCGDPAWIRIPAGT